MLFRSVVVSGLDPYVALDAAKAVEAEVRDFGALADIVHDDVSSTNSA